MNALRAPTPGNATPGPRRYYRHGDILVTDQWFCARGYRYHLDDLANVMLVRGSLHTGAAVAMVIGLAEALLAVPLIAMWRQPAVCLFAFVALVVPTVVAAVCVKRWPAAYELWAEHRGATIRLWETRDEREFGQVVRAFRRAMEGRD